MIRFNHFNFNVVDLDRSLTFYRDALGLEPVRRKTASDGSFQLVYLGDGETDFQLELTWLRDRGAKPYDLGECEFHLAFVTDQYDALYPSTRRWAACALKIPPWGSISSPIRMATGSRSCR